MSVLVVYTLLLCALCLWLYFLRVFLEFVSLCLAWLCFGWLCCVRVGGVHCLCCLLFVWFILSLLIFTFDEILFGIDLAFGFYVACYSLVAFCLDRFVL